MKKLETELNAKLFEESEYLENNMRVEIVGIDKKTHSNYLKRSINYAHQVHTQAIKSVRWDDPHLDEYVLTKTTKPFQMKEVMLKMSSPIVRNVTPVLETKLRMISIS